jgi:hypothetical protein
MGGGCSGAPGRFAGETGGCGKQKTPPGNDGVSFGKQSKTTRQVQYFLLNFKKNLILFLGF